ncbi:hypothetical protein HBI56_238400 [Parastagonospora nodorum]|uniref:Rhodopsin domain-containing protein n=1 Tax=Phaeosphaeria nodorum (strain SN15 / ATCC MYA-4574 / FGSC 10173) TaxID=321614 RepID=A0A7U2FDA2_PHANO|nr:hypothetical protein HBH56_108020 [Parastagonospora nodorum]QRD03162.1 hypothetical protein JI435_099290 [Parastagonospora nodorum SN15]KAH3922291.1 hypothetical protein HBH54_225120 [Parastagonospora nodorum]KAH3974247.1 hypothetical protein HBH51_094440 [Parastagonospora nodorum]KAH3979394.1 hypothetical protein HBH52_103090 [Parastagonospora nodorum]
MAYGGDHDRRAFAITINWVFTCISLCTVTLRFASRRLLEGSRLEIDDGMIVFAMLVVLARTIWLSVNVSMGFGRHLTDLLKEDPANALRLSPSSYGLTVLSLWTFVIPKIPVVALLTRLFVISTKRLGRILWTMLAVLIVWNSIMTVIAFAKCDPVRKNWQPALPGTCLNPKIYLYMGYFSGAYSAFLDFVYAIYPMVKVWQLQMEQSRKTLIVLSFSLGIPAGIVSIVKITTIASLLEAGDPTFATVPLEVWNVVESSALIIAANVPMTKPIMSLAFSRLKRFTSYISSFASRDSQGGSKLSTLPSNPSGSGSKRMSALRQGWQRQDSREDFLLEDTRLTSVVTK